jgi:hypothetical protein
MLNNGINTLSLSTESLLERSGKSLIQKSASSINAVLGTNKIIGISSAEEVGNNIHAICSFSDGNDVDVLRSSLNVDGCGIFRTPTLPGETYHNEFLLILPNWEKRCPLLMRQSEIHDQLLKEQNAKEGTPEQRTAYQLYIEHFRSEQQKLTLKEFITEDISFSGSAFKRFKLIQKKCLKPGLKIRLSNFMTRGEFKILKITSKCNILIQAGMDTREVDPSIVIIF